MVGDKERGVRFFLFGKKKRCCQFNASGGVFFAAFFLTNALMEASAD